MACQSVEARTRTLRPVCQCLHSATNKLCIASQSGHGDVARVHLKQQLARGIGCRLELFLARSNLVVPSTDPQVAGTSAFTLIVLRGVISLSASRIHIGVDSLRAVLVFTLCRDEPAFRLILCHTYHGIAFGQRGFAIQVGQQ